MIVAPFFGMSGDARLHPWTVTTYSEKNQHFSGKYYDFRGDPDLIEQVLEDFLPHSHRPAVKRFYAFLRWINGPDSNLETNDSAFRAPHDADSDVFDFPLQCDGRVEIIHRDMAINTDPEAFYMLIRSACVFLQLQRRDFSAGFVEISHAKTAFAALPEDQRMGARLSCRFIAYGNNENQAFANLVVVIDAIWAACRDLSAAFPTGE